MKIIKKEKNERKFYYININIFDNYWEIMV